MAETFSVCWQLPRGFHIMTCVEKNYLSTLLICQPLRPHNFLAFCFCGWGRGMFACELQSGMNLSFAIRAACSNSITVILVNYEQNKFWNICELVCWSKPAIFVEIWRHWLLLLHLILPYNIFRVYSKHITRHCYCRAWGECIGGIGEVQLLWKY